MRGYTRHLYSEHRRMVRKKHFGGGLTKRDQSYWDSVRRKLNVIESREQGPRLDKLEREFNEEYERIAGNIAEIRRLVDHAA